MTINTAEELFDVAGKADESTDTEATSEAASEEASKETGDTEATGETDKGEAKAESESEGASPVPESETTVPLSAIHGERDKRKNAERERDDLQAKLNEIDKPEPTSVLVDETKFRQEIFAEFDQKLDNQRYDQSRTFADREFGADVITKKSETFRALAVLNPALQQQVRNASSPYHEMVRIVDQHADLDKMKDMDSYKKQIRAEVKAEVEKELKAKIDGKSELLDSIPESLAGESSTGVIESAKTHTPKTPEQLYD